MHITLWTSLSVFLADQISKFIVVQFLNLKDIGAIDVFPPFFQLRMAWNTGVNFGLFSSFDMRWVLVTLALVITVAVLFWVKRDGGSKWVFFSAGLLVGGAIGNVIDRLIYGAVADFLNFSCCGINNPYAFNVADIAVFGGAIGLVLFHSDNEHPKEKSKRS